MYKKYIERVHPEDRFSVERALELANRKKSVFRYENRIVLPDGSVRHVQSTGHRNYLAQPPGEASSVGIVMDITERRAAEEALRRLQAELGRASRLSVMGELAGSIIHEISQPLTTIITSAQACLRWLNRARDAATRVAEDVRRAVGVVHGLRALFAEVLGNQLAQVDLCDSIAEVVTLLRGELERGRIVLELDLPPSQEPALGDRVQLQQVVINLIRNGIEA